MAQKRLGVRLFILPDGIQHIVAQSKALRAELFEKRNDSRNCADPPCRHEDTDGANHVQTRSAGDSPRRPIIDHNHICAAVVRKTYDLSLTPA
jgi:hypothetical protein